MGTRWRTWKLPRCLGSEGAAAGPDEQRDQPGEKEGEHEDESAARNLFS